MRLSCTVAVGVAILSCHDRPSSFFVNARLGDGEMGKAKDEDDGARVRQRQLPPRGGKKSSYEAKMARRGYKPETLDQVTATGSPEIVDLPKAVELPKDVEIPKDVELPKDDITDMIFEIVEIPEVLPPDDPPDDLQAPPVRAPPELVVGANDLNLPEKIVPLEVVGADELNLPKILPLDAEPTKNEAVLNTAAMESPPSAPTGTLAEETKRIGSVPKPELVDLPPAEETKRIGSAPKPELVDLPPADLSVPPPPPPGVPAPGSFPPPPPLGVPGPGFFGGPPGMGMSAYRPWVCTAKRTDIANRYERFEAEKADATARCQRGDDLPPATAEMYGDEYDDDTLPDGVKRKQWVGGDVNKNHRRCDYAFGLDPGFCLPSETCVKDVDSCACNALPCYRPKTP